MNPDATEFLESALSPVGGPDGFRDALRGWFRAEGRDYPWRRTRDPYAILVSEAMLQQTRIATVLGRGYYERWMRAFPDWKTLAAGEEAAVLKCWEGLGYYNRARNLWRTARIVAGERGGRFPEDPDEILALPGVGPYTAGAVLSIAFGRRAAVVDGNVARVLARVFALETAVNAPDGNRALWSWAGALVPESDPGLFNADLMELGQRVCRPSQPDCLSCPVREGCEARRRGETERFPVKRRGPGVTAKEERVLLGERDGRVFLCREEGSRRRGLWRLPELAGEGWADLDERFRFDYPITRYRVTLRVFAPPLSWRPEDDAAAGGGWFEWGDPSALPPLGAPYRKALDRYLEIRGADDPLA